MQCLYIKFAIILRSPMPNFLTEQNVSSSGVSTSCARSRAALLSFIIATRAVWMNSTSPRRAVSAFSMGIVSYRMIERGNSKPVCCKMLRNNIHLIYLSQPFQPPFLHWMWPLIILSLTLSSLCYVFPVPVSDYSLPAEAA